MITHYRNLKEKKKNCSRKPRKYKLVSWIDIGAVRLSRSLRTYQHLVNMI